MLLLLPIAPVTGTGPPLINRLCPLNSYLHDCLSQACTSLNAIHCYPPQHLSLSLQRVSESGGEAATAQMYHTRVAPVEAGYARLTSELEATRVDAHTLQQQVG